MSAIYYCPHCRQKLLRDQRSHRGPVKRLRSHCERTGRNAVLRLLVARPTVFDVMHLTYQDAVGPHTEAK